MAPLPPPLLDPPVLLWDKAGFCMVSQKMFLFASFSRLTNTTQDAFYRVDFSRLTYTGAPSAVQKGSRISYLSYKMVTPITSGQGHVGSRGDLSRSWCMSVDAYRRGQHIGTISSVLSLFYQKLGAKAAFYI